MVRLSELLRLRSTEVRSRAQWPPPAGSAGAVRWRSRLALIYAVSTWGVIGSLAFLHFRNKKEEAPAESGEQLPDTPDAEQLHDLADPEPSEQRGRITFTATVRYKENFVPLTTRISNFFAPKAPTENSSLDK